MQPEAPLQTPTPPAHFSLKEESRGAGLAPALDRRGHAPPDGVPVRVRADSRLRPLAPPLPAGPRRPSVPVSRATRQRLEAAGLALQPEPRATGNRRRALQPEASAQPQPSLLLNFPNLTVSPGHSAVAPAQLGPRCLAVLELVM